MPSSRNASSADADPAARQVRTQLGVVLRAWIFGAIWIWIISGAAMTRFARELGMPDSAFGFLAALPFLGTLWQLPASIALERLGQRKWLFIWTCGISRLLWVLAGLIPWFVPQQRLWWPALILALMFSWAGANAGTPAWMNWMADVIPKRVRGRFFARRNRMGQIIGVVVTLIVGYLLDLADQHSNGSQLPLWTLSGLLVIAGVVGLVDIVHFAWIPDESSRPAHKQHQPVLRNLMRPLSDKQFRVYLLYNFTMAMAVGFMGQYAWLYAFDEVRLSNSTANLMLVAMPLVVMSASYGAWGRVIDRLGKKPVLVLGGSLLVLSPIGWTFITSDRILLGYITVLLGVVSWPGVEVANFNIILELSSSREKEGGGGSSYVAVNSAVTAIGGVLSGAAAGAVAGRFQDLRIPVEWLGITVTYHSIVFMASALLRAVACMVALGIAEPHATGTRDAFRYMSSSFYDNVRLTWLIPSRLLGQAVRSTFKISPRR